MVNDARMLTLPAALAEAARLHGNRPAYATGRGGRAITWSGLHQSSLDFAAGLVGLGFARGDRVAICAENSIEWLIACHAVLAAGGVIVPIYYDLKETEIAEQVRRPSCRFLVASEAVLPKIPERSPGLEKTIVVGNVPRPARGGLPWRHPAEMQSFEAVSAAAESREALVPPEPEDLAAIVFTSGTTGGAKGVMLSHRNFMANGHSVCDAIDLVADDAVLLVLPLHHAMPFMAAVVLPAMKGAKVIIENDVRRVRDRLAEESPTIFFGVPALFDIMYRNVMARAEAEGRLATLQDWQRRVSAVKRLTGVNVGPLVFNQVHRALGGRLRFLASGGAALNPATARNFFSLGLPLLQGWGMTEAAPVVALQRFSARRFRFSRYYEDHAGSVGMPVPGVEVKLMDVPEKDILVSVGGEGEAIIRGENVFRGYWQAEEQTRAAMQGEWLRTGDLARFDRQGNIYLTGRSKYIIVLDSGEKVHPDELEENLAASPLVEDVCVVGRKARDRTQVAAVVYPNVTATLARLKHEGVEASEDTVRRLIAAEVEGIGRGLAPYKRVSQLLIADAPLPKTPIQKVARAQLADEYQFSLKRWRESSAADGTG